MTAASSMRGQSLLIFLLIFADEDHIVSPVVALEGGEQDQSKPMSTCKMRATEWRLCVAHLCVAF